MNKILIVGLGIGELYKTVAQQINYKTVTVDIDPNRIADYTSLDRALSDHPKFQIAVVTVPNYLHGSIARQIASHCDIVLIEKPGLSSSYEYKSIIEEYPNTRFMMIKNNQYRFNTSDLISLYNSSKTISLNWLNHDRVPKPGSWFTNKLLSFGGVGHDLVPHLLSFYTLFEPEYQNTIWLRKCKEQRWQLQDLTSSDYGQVNSQGVYNVDDFVCYETESNNKNVTVQANWRTLQESMIGIQFDNQFIQLGLCPESAYQLMLETAIDNFHNNSFWEKQHQQDIWIHNQL